MPEWLLILLFLLVFGFVNFLAYRFGHMRGYHSGADDALTMNTQLDDVLRTMPNRPTIKSVRP